ncbi:hypothetical protein MTO96_000617 [Rhipicephalus appendiculatus]
MRPAAAGRTQTGRSRIQAQARGADDVCCSIAATLQPGSRAARRGDTTGLRVATLIVSGMVSSRPYAASGFSSRPGDDALSGAATRYGTPSRRLAQLTRLLYLRQSQAARPKPCARLRSTPAPDTIWQRTPVRHQLG